MRELYAQRKIKPKKKVTRMQGGSSLSTGNNVSPGSSGWTVKVVVAEKFSPRIAQKSPTKYQNLILMDTELSSKLCIPTDEKDFTEIKNIQGLKTVYMSCNNCNKISNENYALYVVAEIAQQPYLVAEEPRKPPLVAELARQPPFVAD
ncbi:hypothetical protein Fot_09473 [Forsythia ovata]|uniref:Uncharacterized protein n=1 Tax=Forsythia ovata TaxID=205694 RepID=A0ABD1WGM1_9LAMI